MKTGAITRFEGDYFFLSNFYPAGFSWRGMNWFCSEQAFQWAKSLYPQDNSHARMKAHDIGMRMRDTGNPNTAKKYGREFMLDVKAWDQQKVHVMREIVHAKFQTVPGLAGQLINTGAMMLVEGNTWGDEFWGRVQKNGKWTGLNTLGVILMEERGYWLHHEFGE